MKSARRYWSLWRTLPVEERRARTGRVLERWLRRPRAVRRLGLMPDQPRWSGLRRATHTSLETLVDRLRRDAPERGPLFCDLSRRADTIRRHLAPHARRILEATEPLLERRFDLLGSGSSHPLRDDGRIDWQLDWRSGHRWQADAHHSDIRLVAGDGSDVKVPWELSRFQHLLVLGQAFRLTHDAELASRCAVEARTQIDDWIASNPRALGIHWTCAMEVAIRAYGWLAALALFRTSGAWDAPFLRRLVRSLWVHGRHIRRHLEIGSDGLKTNHFLTNALGLLALGTALPELCEAAAWRRFGWEALQGEIETQVLEDGVSFERSLPYHGLAMEVFIHGALLARARGEALPPGYRDRLGRMLDFSAACTRDDGSLPQWGDNDDGRLLPFDRPRRGPLDQRHLQALAGVLLDRPEASASAGDQVLGLSWLLGRADERPREMAPAMLASQEFPKAAFYVLRHADLHATVPCGPVGTDGLGNHTHNDLLSLTIWAGGVEWIVDPGTGTYSGDPELRQRLRSTAAHATLQVGTREQNTLGEGVDGLFRVEARAFPSIDRWVTDGERAELSAHHRGFEVATHERQVRMDGERRLFHVTDRLTELTRACEATVRFPVHPRVLPEPRQQRADWPAGLIGIIGPHRQEVSPFVVRLTRGDRALWVAMLLPANADARLGRAPYSPGYGRVETAPVIEARSHAGPPRGMVIETLLWSPGAAPP